MLTRKSRLFGVPITVILLLVIVVGVVAAANKIVTQEPVHAFPAAGGVDPIPGTMATLSRFEDKVHISFPGNNLDAGHAYTLWAVNWDDPGNCNGACDMEDVCSVAGSSVYYVAGQVIDDEGAVNFNATIHEGREVGEFACHEENTMPGLGDAENAEIHFVARSHGDQIPGLVAEQIHTFMGGCGINTCVDQQAAAFK
jgi:hypothetical protein